MVFVKSVFCALAFFCMSVVTAIFTAPMDALIIFQLAYENDGDLSKVTVENFVKKSNE